jgi:hypothetical protein
MFRRSDESGCCFAVALPALWSPLKGDGVAGGVAAGEREGSIAGGVGCRTPRRRPSVGTGHVGGMDRFAPDLAAATRLDFEKR